MIRNQSLFGQLNFGVGQGMKRSAGGTARAAERRRQDYSTVIVAAHVSATFKLTKPVRTVMTNFRKAAINTTLTLNQKTMTQLSKKGKKAEQRKQKLFKKRAIKIRNLNRLKEYGVSKVARMIIDRNEERAIKYSSFLMKMINTQDSSSLSDAQLKFLLDLFNKSGFSLSRRGDTLCLADAGENPKTRLNELQVGNPTKLYISETYGFEESRSSATAVETKLHKHFKKRRI